MGAGGSSVLVTCFGVISNLYSDDMESKIGIMEALGGLGLMGGPFLGGFIFNLVGYKALFFIYTMIFFSLTVTAYKVLPPDNPVIEEEKTKISFAKLLSMKKVLIILVVVVYGMAGPSYIEPVLADSLKESQKLSSL